MERRYIQVLLKHEHRKSRVAELLGKDRTTLYRKLKELGLADSWGRLRAVMQIATRCRIQRNLFTGCPSKYLILKVFIFGLKHAYWDTATGRAGSQLEIPMSKLAALLIAAALISPVFAQAPATPAPAAPAAAAPAPQKPANKPMKKAKKEKKAPLRPPLRP